MLATDVLASVCRVHKAKRTVRTGLVSFAHVLTLDVVQSDNPRFQFSGADGARNFSGRGALPDQVLELAVVQVRQARNVACGKGERLPHSRPQDTEAKELTIFTN
jgi:hypothetical protein